MGKLLFIFIFGQGHMNVCVNVAKYLLYKYPEHEVYFNVDGEYFKKIKSSCNLFKPVQMDELDFDNPRKEAKFQEKFIDSFFKSGIERFVAALEPVSKFQDLYILCQGRIEKVIAQVQPDVILMDQLCNLPFVQNKKIPWY